MKFITDVAKIELLARAKESENWKFRAYLKGCDISVKKLDTIVHRFYKMVASEIDCKQCAWCCEVCYPLLKESDITRFAKGLKMPVAEFKTNFLKPVDDEPEKLTFKELPCPFLKNNLCTNYGYRPNDCRSFPHLHKKGFISRTVSVIENSAICPIVYNVYELLKEELWHRSGDFEDEDF